VKLYETAAIIKFTTDINLLVFSCRFTLWHGKDITQRHDNYKGFVAQLEFWLPGVNK